MTSTASVGEGGSASSGNEAPRIHIAIDRYKLAKIAGGVVAILALAFGLLNTKLFAVDHINVTGAQHLSRDELIEKAGVHRGAVLLRVDVDHARRVLRAEPWIADATVSRHWPSTIAISVVERTPVAIAQSDDNKWVQIGAGGIVLGSSDRPVAGLPLLVGAKPSAEPGAKVQDGSMRLVSVAAKLPEGLRKRVVQMDVNDDGVRLGIDAGTVVIVGDDKDLEAKLMAASAVLSKEDARQIETLDVRSETRPLAHMRGTASAAAATSTSTSAPKLSTSRTTIPTSTTAVKRMTSTTLAGHG